MQRNFFQDFDILYNEIHDKEKHNNFIAKIGPAQEGGGHEEDKRNEQVAQIDPT